jgi:hypothetical protein
MHKPMARKAKIISAVIFSIFVCFPVSASVTFNSVVFDSAVINDNANQATPVNYSCIQSGNTITLSGRQPSSVTNVTYFYNHSSIGEEWKFMVGVNFSGLTDTNSLAGIMYYSQMTGIEQWARIGISGNRKVFCETMNLGGPSQKTLICTLSVSVSTAYILAKIEGGSLDFFLSYNPAITDTILHIGAPAYFTFQHSFGFFLEPHVTAGYEQAVFNSVSIVPRIPTNGIPFLFKYSIPLINGLTDYAAMNLPAGFFNTPIKLVQDLRNLYIAGGNTFADRHQQWLFENMRAMKNVYTLITLTGTEKFEYPQCADLSCRHTGFTHYR